MRSEQRDRPVGGEALGAAAEVELDPGRAGDRAGDIVDIDAPPGGRRVRRGGLRVGRRGERLAQIGARLADQRAAVAGADDGAEERRIREAAGEVGAGQRGADGGAEQR